MKICVNKAIVYKSRDNNAVFYECTIYTYDDTICINGLLPSSYVWFPLFFYHPSNRMFGHIHKVLNIYYLQN